MVPIQPGGVLLSASGLNRFHDCETRFLHYAEQNDDDRGIKPGPALLLGSATHTLLEQRWLGRDWRAHLPVLARDLSPNWSPRWNLPDIASQAERLVSRHEEHYPELPECLATELYFKLRHPTVPWLEIHGYQDGLVRVDDGEHAGLWVVETKTMGRWDRLEWLDCDPQLGTYMWAAKTMGFDIKGVLFDALLTTAWKTAERPTAESFRRLWLPYDEGLVNVTMLEYARVAARLRELQTYPERASMNLGRQCVRCPNFGDCHGERLER